MPIIRRPFSNGNFLGGAFTGRPKKNIDSSTQKKILWTGGSPNHIKRILPDKWWAGEKNGSFSNGFLLFSSESFFGKKGYRRQKNHRSRVNIFIDRNPGTVILQKKRRVKGKKLRKKWPISESQVQCTSPFGGKREKREKSRLFFKMVTKWWF